MIRSNQRLSKRSIAQLGVVAVLALGLAVIGPVLAQRDDPGAAVEEMMADAKVEAEAPPALVMAEEPAVVEVKQTRAQAEKKPAPAPEPQYLAYEEPVYAAYDEGEPAGSSELSVVGLRPFSPEANYMSLAGFYRDQYYQRTGHWLTREEAVAAVDTQIATASR